MRPPPLPRNATALVGPVLIVVAVIVVLHDIVLGGKFTNLNPDVPTVFLVNHCFLGESLRAGHIPTWNPYPMGGVPFLADPQSGWLYAPAVLLYTLLPCSVAIRFFIALQPILGGLGVYALLRGERCSRVSATTGGLVLALALCGSKMGVSIPFTDAMAWTALLLAALGKTLRSITWRQRLLWATATALAWGQLACAHLSHGLVMGTSAAVIYGIYVARRERRGGRSTGRTVAVLAGVIVAATAVLSLAHLIPILSFVPRSTIGLGYDQLQVQTARLTGGLTPPFTIYRALGWTWPLRFVTAPGFYLGAIALMLMGAGFVSRRTRGAALCFGIFGGLFYILGQRTLVEHLAPRLGGIIGDFYRHGAGRFLYAVVLAAVILVGLGVEAWLTGATKRERIWMLAPGIVIWGPLPFAFGVWPSRMVLPIIAGGIGGFVLYRVMHQKELAWLIPALLVFELGINAFWGQNVEYSKAHDGLETEADSWIPFRPLPAPTMNAAKYVHGGAIEHAAKNTPYRLMFLGNGLTDIFRPLLSHVELAEGYNPVELNRYWRYIRSIEPDDLRYNMSLFPHLPQANAMNLLGIGWVATTPGAVPARGAEEVVTSGGRTLYRLPDPPPRAVVMRTWKVIPSADRARQSVAGPAFDPDRTVIVERSIAPSPAPPLTDTPQAKYQWRDGSHASITLDTPDTAVVLIRNAWDEGWSATVDGDPAEVIPADYFLQGVVVDAGGHHTIELSYEEPSVVPSLIVSTTGLIALLLAAYLCGRKRHVPE